MRFEGPGSNFELLFEQLGGQGNGLPPQLREIYGGDWLIPNTSERVYSYSNFVISHDGKISFNVPGHEGGGDVSGFNKHDQWVMALARARADAVVVGANTLRTEHEHLWTAEFIFPNDAEAFAEFRKLENRKQYPLQVMVTNSGDLSRHAAIFEKQLPVLIATSTSGAKRVEALRIPGIEIRSFGDNEVDLALLYRTLHAEYGIRTALCEGGPRLYASLIQAGQLDEEFLTLSPVVVGSSGEQPRPGLFEGIALEPGNEYLARLASVRRFENHLFLRTIWR